MREIHMIDRRKLAIFVKWQARIWGTLVLVFVSVFLGADALGGQQNGGLRSVSETVTFIFFPLSTVIGLALALRWPGLGGLIATAGMAGLFLMRFDLIANPIFSIVIAPAGILYSLSGFLSRGGGTRPEKEPRLSTKGRVGCAFIAVAAPALVIAVLLPSPRNKYSMTTEKDVSFDRRVERIFIVANVEERLMPIFAHSLEHSIASAFQSNGIDTFVEVRPRGSQSPANDSGNTGLEGRDAAMQIDIDPLYRTREDGYQAIVGTVFEVSVFDSATDGRVWHATGRVDYIRMFGSRYRAIPDIRREFAFNTTAAIVPAFVTEVNGDDPTPIYTSIENRKRHGQRAD
jgi:hypothetical protein